MEFKPLSSDAATISSKAYAGLRSCCSSFARSFSICKARRRHAASLLPTLVAGPVNRPDKRRLNKACLRARSRDFDFSVAVLTRGRISPVTGPGQYLLTARRSRALLETPEIEVLLQSL